MAAAALLWRPIVQFRTHSFGPFDRVTQSQWFTRVTDQHEISNMLLTDPTVQMHPWMLFAREEFWRAQLPIWNPYCGSGEPLVANYQSAIFSPFSAPYYLLPFKAALLASAWLKLFVAGIFSLLFLRRLGCTYGSALFGAVAMMASGVMLMLLQHPHSGAIACLPASLYFAELFFADWERGQQRGMLRGAAALALSIGIGVLSGHPETFFYCAVLLFAYCVFRLSTSPRAERVGWHAPRRFGRASALLVLSAVVGLALGAVQVLPFAEYLRQSLELSREHAGDLYFSAANVPFQLFPNLVGSPMDASLRTSELPWPNYQETNTFFVGGVPLLCALVALIWFRRHRAIVFFASVIALWVVYGYDVGGLGHAVNQETPLGTLPVYRTHPLWVPSVAFLAALGLNAFERTAPRVALKRYLSLGLIGALALAAALFGASKYIANVAPALDHTAAEVSALSREHVVLVSTCFALGVLGLTLVATARGPRVRNVGYGALLLAVVVTSAQSIAHYVPTVEDRFVFPRTRAVTELQRLVGSDKFVVIGSDQIMPETNVVYGLHTVGGYDVLGVSDYTRVAHHFFGIDRSLSMPRHASARAMELFGVRYALARGNWLPIDTELGDRIVMPLRATAYIAEDFDPRGEYESDPSETLGHEVFRVTASRDELDGFAIQLLCDAEKAGAQIHYALTDADSGQEIASGSKTLRELARLPRRRYELAVRFPLVADSARRAYDLELSSLDPNAPFRAVPRIGAPSGPRSDSNVAGKRPVLDLGYGQNDFEKIGTSSVYSVFRSERSPGRAWIVGAATVADSHERAFELVTARDFRPLEQVVVEDRSASVGEPGRAGQAALVVDEPRRVELQAECERDGWLVVSQPYYPGWSALVDGVASPVRKVNYGFVGLPLTQGSHRVVLRYEPLSVFGGLALSVLAALAILGVLVYVRRERRELPITVSVPRRSRQLQLQVREPTLPWAAFGPSAPVRPRRLATRADARGGRWLWLLRLATESRMRSHGLPPK